MTKLWHYNHDLPLHISGHELSASVWDWSLHPNCWFPDDKFRGDHWNEVVECPQEWFRHRPGGQSLRHGRPSTRSSHTSHQHCKKTTGITNTCTNKTYETAICFHAICVHNYYSNTKSTWSIFKCLVTVSGLNHVSSYRILLIQLYYTIPHLQNV